MMRPRKSRDLGRLPLLAMVAAGALATSSCRSGTTPAPPRPATIRDPNAGMPAPRADGRLPALAIPRSYDLALAIDPAAANFSGTARIEVDVPNPTSWIVLSGRDLHVTRAAIRRGSETTEGRTVIGRTVQGRAAEEIAIAFPAPLPAGPATLLLEWNAPWGDDLAGLYRVKDGERTYAFTQFEATDARRAFPSFDEPGYKTPFTVHITTTKGNLAFANAAESSRDTGDPRTTTYHFATTRPLPTYLVAFAVGDFDVREIPRAEGSVPIRLIAPKGKTGMGGMALTTTSELLQVIEHWLGIPYPYDKLDIVAVPEFAAGAMENAGLVTFREDVLLLDDDQASFAARRRQASIIAHELAHQWFGNLVTAAWWNDLWLNEGFATWMETQAIDAWRPQYQANLDATLATLGVMEVDGRTSTRAVRQPVATTGQIQEAFDGMTYEKGAAILSTIASWIGDRAFRTGLRSYLTENAHRSASADGFLEAMDRASGQDVTTMAGSLLDQAGVPEITVDFHADRGGRWHAELIQEPWRPLGKSAEEAVGNGWTLPVCVAAEGAKEPECTTLMAGAPAMAGGRGAPRYLRPNVYGGYYRYSLPAAQYARLASAKKTLAPTERLSLVSNAWAEVQTGRLDPAVLLDLLTAFDTDTSRQLIELQIAILGDLDRTLVDDAARSSFRRFVAARLGPRKAALGWAPKAGQGPGTDDLAIVRRSVLLAMGDLAQDEATLREADEIARRWLVDPSSLNPDAGAVGLELASRHAGPDRLEQLKTSASQAKTPEHRRTALRALAGFDDPEILSRALAWTLGPELHPTDVLQVLGAAFARRASRTTTEGWVRAHWDELRKKLPGALGRGLFRGAGIACTREEIDATTGFYSPRASTVQGADLPLRQALEASELCASLRKSQAAPLSRALLKVK